MNKPTPAQSQAGYKAARQAIENYSEWDSSMIPEGALDAVIDAALLAALNVPAPQPPKGI